MDTKTFEYKRVAGGRLSEFFDGISWRFEYEEGDKKYVLPMYEPFFDSKPEIVPYLGHKLEEIIDSGKDILGDELTSGGEVRYSDVIGVLPEIKNGAYCFVGGVASHSDLTVDTRGVVYPQMSGRDREPKALFAPWWQNPILEGILPKQIMLSEEYPILINRYDAKESIFELIYFVEPADSDKEPTLWVREKIYEKSSPSEPKYRYSAFSVSRELSFEETVKRGVPEKNVIEAFADTVAFWVKFAERGVRLELPEKRLERAVRGAVASAAVTCTADRPHYGHKFYGKELHDNFPPNFIWLIETACVMGREAWARRVFEYMLNYALTDEGRFVYRQGADFNMGASAAEYGYILFIAKRYFSKLGIAHLSEDGVEKLIGMGNVLLAHCVECPELGGRILVKMCAEADTNNRIHAYLNNNLWSVRGLRALADIIDELKLGGAERYRNMADTVFFGVSSLLDEKKVYDERYGCLPPFRFDYTPAPHTLSLCKDTFAPMSKEAYERYVGTDISRDDKELSGQDIGENCYANYRYYPESLSAMLLPEELAGGIAELRSNLGGEILGMTRFISWLDDWPVLHYARFLIESGRINKYLMLLYAHTELHGNRERLCYYEQVKLDGRVSANDCLPSLLTTPCMVGWMLAYEKMSGDLALLSALPAEWYKKGFIAKGLGYSGGKVDIESDGETLNIEFSSTPTVKVEIHFRDRERILPSDILLGAEHVAKIDGNKLLLKNGTQKAQIKLK